MVVEMPKDIIDLSLTICSNARGLMGELRKRERAYADAEIDLDGAIRSLGELLRFKKKRKKPTKISLLKQVLTKNK